MHRDAAFGHRDAMGVGLGGDIDHVGLSLGVEMGQGAGAGGGVVWHGRTLIGFGPGPGRRTVFTGGSQEPDHSRGIIRV